MRPRLTRIGAFSLSWGKSLRWDDRRQRLYFVDCATQTLHWLDNAEPPLHSMKLPTMPAGLVLTDDGRLVACLDDGLHVVDPDAGSSELFATYPGGMHGRANDANADGAGNLVTGTLNLVPGPGASWWFSAAEVSDECSATTPRWTAHPTVQRPTLSLECGVACWALARSPASPQPDSIVWWRCRWPIPAM